MNKMLLLSTLALMIQVPVLPPPPPPPPPPPILVDGAGVFTSSRQPAPPIAQTGEGTIEGIVKRPDTQEPISEVQITLTGPPVGTPPLAGQLNSITDSSGKFSFKQLPPGRYTVRANRDNYFAPGVAAVPLTGATTSVTVDPAQKVTNVALDLVPGGTISGIIRDDKGQPILNARVAAMRSAYRDGRLWLQSTKTVQSDDRGDYRLWGLAPGEYYVRAATNSIAAGPLGAAGGTYYPGELDFDRATAVRIQPGSETAADIRILPQQQFKISGTFVNTIPELASDPLGFLLMPHDIKLDDGSAGNLIPNQAAAQGSGAFQIMAPRPGLYELMAVAGMKRDPSVPITASSLTTGTPQFYTGRVTVDIRDRDIEGVKVTVARGVDLNLHVNRGPAPATAFQSLRFGLRPLDAVSTPLTTHLQIAKPLSPQGDLQLTSVPVGTYAITTTVVPPGVYIADIRQSARSIYDQNVITVGKDAVDPIEVTLATGGGRVEGVVEGTEKIPNVQISLVPQGSRRGNSLFFKRTTVRDGRFTLADLPPGEYKLFAWAEMPSQADENEKFMSTYEQQGKAVTITAGGSVTGITLPLLRK